MWPCVGKFQRRKLVWTTMKQKQTHIKDWSNGDWKHWTCNSFYDQIHVDKFYICLEKHYRTGSSQDIKVNQQWTIEIMHVLLKVSMDLLVINCKIPNFVIFSWHSIYFFGCGNICISLFKTNPHLFLQIINEYLLGSWRPVNRKEVKKNWK